LDARLMNNGKQVGPKQWDIDFLLAYLAERAGDVAVEEDNEGQIVIYTGLTEAPDGTLWKEEDNG
jgi:hypothetical protein